MKPLTYSLLIIIIMSFSLLSSCNDDDSDNCTDPSTEFTWTQNRSIELDPKVDSIMMNDTVLFFISEYTITDGSSNLFEFTKILESCKDIADSGGSSNLSMIVPADSTDSFSYRDQEILETSAFLLISAFVGSPLHSVEEGEISGTRLDEDSWRVSIDVVTKPLDVFDRGEPARISINEVFTLQ